MGFVRVRLVPAGMMSSPLRSVDEIRQHQLRALQSGLQTVLRTNAFYRDRLHEVADWNDFERLPFTTKADLMLDPRASTLRHQPHISPGAVRPATSDISHERESAVALARHGRVVGMVGADLG
jgi:hypothetical protein